MGCDGEAEAELHAARIHLHGSVEDAAELGELDDLVEAPADVGPAHAEDLAVEPDVLAGGQLGMDAGTDLDQRGDTSANADASGGRIRDARDELERGGFPRPVGADDREGLAFLHLEGDVVEGERAARLGLQAAQTGT